ncbi:MAG: S-layer homology domain-containing protein [Clostridiales bacterium]|nr:S-layer homology domain-containing protein [Clostridiales bacterium]
MKITGWNFTGIMVLFAAVLLSAAGGTVNASGPVAVNATNFPDPAFRAYVTAEFDFNEDGKLSEAEIGDANRIEIDQKSVKNLKGIEYFPELTYLSCIGNGLTSIDVSKNTKLKTLKCDMNGLTSLNVKNNKNLEELSCWSNKIGSLDVGANTKLTELACGINQLKSLDVSKCTLIKTLSCSGNKISSLNLKQNTKLETLYCSDNLLTSLDLSKNVDLGGLECYGNKITSLDLSKHKYLSIVKCNDNQLTSLNVSGAESLITLQCQGNKLTKLDLSGNDYLKILYCSDNQLTSLNVKNRANLNELDCQKNKLTSLNLTGCGSLDNLSCNDNKLKTLVMTGSTPYYFYCYNNELQTLKFALGGSCILDCSKNKLTTLDLDIDKYYLENQAFIGSYEIDCSSNNLSSLDLSCPGYLGLLEENITDLNISSNKFTAFDISKYPNLSQILCSSNKIKSIDLTKNPDILGLSCADNQLTKLNLSKNTKLTYLDCSSNAISSLDISNNGNLEILYCASCNLKTLVLSDHFRLADLDCSKNKISKLDLDNNKVLRAINCSSNSLTKLKIDRLGDLYFLDCSDNQLKALDVSNNAALENLFCQKNKLTKLDVTYCKDITTIYQNGKSTEYKGSGYHYLDYVYALTSLSSGDHFCFDAGVKVTPSAKVLTIKPDSQTVVCGNQISVKALMDGKEVGASWSSSDDNVAIVFSNTQKILGKMAGTVTITAKAEGKTASCVITVLYKDVTKSTDFWYSPTNYLTALGVVKGYDKQTKFKPANNCTRAQMVTFIWRLMGEPAPKAKTCKFKDVKKTDYFYKACIWGNENHIVEGYKDGTFGPQIVCARKHAVTFLWRLAGCPDPKTTKNPFKDVKTSDYFYKATLWASGKKILAGYDDGTFRPGGDCLRRQMVTFLYKYDKYINGRG